MNCKKCGIDLTEKEYQTIAQWNFCEDCFKEIMRKVEEEKNTEPVLETPVQKAGRFCVVCAKPLEEKEGLDLLGLLFCDRCYENIVNRPEESPSQDGLKEEEDFEQKGVAQVHVNLISQVKCHQCGKTIRAIAGREYEGELYCPDCFFSLSDAHQPKSRVTPDDRIQAGRCEVSVSSPVSENSVCQSCLRQANRKSLQMLDGFEICSACLAADSDMALEIARLRHRRLLEKMKNELL